MRGPGWLCQRFCSTIWEAGVLGLKADVYEIIKLKQTEGMWR